MQLPLCGGPEGGMLDNWFLLVIMFTCLEEILRGLLVVSKVVTGLTAGRGVEGDQLLRRVSSFQRTIPTVLNEPRVN
jgi:hypothetical protein